MSGKGYWQSRRLETPSSSTSTSQSDEEVDGEGDTAGGGDQSSDLSEYSTMDESDGDEEESSEGSSTSDKTASSSTDIENLESYATGLADKLQPPLPTHKKVIPVIRPSYFPYVPPYINFCNPDEEAELLPPDLKKHMKWKLSPITPIVVRKTVSCTGFRLLRNTVEWSSTWGKHMKATMFRSLKDYQKLNHVPASFQLGRKDRLWKNFQRFVLKFGNVEFGFLPKSYILPQDAKQLKQAWTSGEKKGRPWIVKPPAAARGTGIKVISKWSQIPKRRPILVQKYISNPMLINDRKFDLRLYVLVTSFHPLKVYIYRDGLVRFASIKYSHDSKHVSDRFMHLTNYSINKNCDLYTENENADVCQGHKWTLKSLWRYLESEGHNVKAVWDKMEDIVIKTLLCAEDSITSCAFNMPNRYNCYELFGFDIILDAKLKPWLLEVNISPSLHSTSPLDLAVKAPLIREVFNIVGYHLSPCMPTSSKDKLHKLVDTYLKLETPVFDKRLYATVLSKEEKAKHADMKSKFDCRNKYLDEILETLTPDDIRMLITAEDELSQCHGFARVFPTVNSHKYFQFFESPRYYNYLFDAWETKYQDQRPKRIQRLQDLCEVKLHLEVPILSKNPILDNPTSPMMPLKQQPSPQTKQQSQYTYADDGQTFHEVEFNGNVNQNCRNMNFNLQKTDQLPDNINNIMDMSSNDLLYPPTLFTSTSSMNVYGDH